MILSNLTNPRWDLIQIMYKGVKLYEVVTKIWFLNNKIFCIRNIQILQKTYLNLVCLNNYLALKNNENYEEISTPYSSKGMSLDL